MGLRKKTEALDQRVTPIIRKVTAEVLKIKAVTIRTNCGRRRNHHLAIHLLITHGPIMDRLASHHPVIPRLIMDLLVSRLHHFKTQNRLMGSPHRSVNMLKLLSRLQFRFIRNFHTQVEPFDEIII